MWLVASVLDTADLNKPLNYESMLAIGEKLITGIEYLSFTLEKAILNKNRS